MTQPETNVTKAVSRSTEVPVHVDQDSLEDSSSAADSTSPQSRTYNLASLKEKDADGSISRSSPSSAIDLADSGNALPPNQSQSAPKIRNDALVIDLCNMIQGSAYHEDPCEFLDRNVNLDLNIIPVLSPSSENKVAELPLHLAFPFSDSRYQMSTRTARQLLAAGANPKEFCGHGRNALQCAAARGRLNGALSLLTDHYSAEDKLAYINSLDQKGNESCAHYLAMSRSSNLEVIKALHAAGVDWTVKNLQGQTPFELAVEYGHLILADFLAFHNWDRRPPEVLDQRRVWKHYPLQSTTQIQAMTMDMYVNAKYLGSEHVRDEIIQLMSPRFRSDRDANDPVGGSGKDPTCISKRLEGINFLSVTIPYFSSEITARIKERTEHYETVIKDDRHRGNRDFNSLGFQCTSTLDEYCHPSLDKITLSDRNLDQVLGRYQHVIPHDSRLILTVPQLWTWVIGTRLHTATQKDFSDEFDGRIFELLHEVPEDMFASEPGPNYIKRLGNLNFGRILATDLCVGVLISECVNKLSTLSLHGISLSLFGIFESSIYQLSARVREYTKGEKLSQSDIDGEKEFILEIDDIREELSMIRSVVIEQEQVWHEFVDARFNGLPSAKVEDFPPKMAKTVEILKRPQAQFEDYKRRISKLDTDAARVATSIALQLDLKAKHASLQEAHVTTLMSAAVIGFTTVTIISTPLAFLTSLFALSIHHSSSTNSTHL